MTFWSISGITRARSNVLFPEFLTQRHGKRASVLLGSLGRANLYSTANIGSSSLIKENVLDTVGNTPVIKLSKRIKQHYEVPLDVNVFVKTELLNPGGSVKDRLAVGILEWAEKHGQIRPGQTVVEASSGNTGIGLALACASKGYPFVCVMAESFSIERRKLMRFLGAKVVLTNPAFKGTGMLIKARDLAEKHGWFEPQQFKNPANTWIHSKTTGPEIINAFQDINGLDYFVTGYGTGGTLTGVGQVLREQSPKTKIVVCEPDNAPMLYSGVKTASEEPHPVWRPHLVQGWAPDFIPDLVNNALESELIDDLRHIGGDAAMQACKDLARFEGITTGTSGGGTLACTLELAKTLPKGSNVLTMLPDGAERYQSTPLFADIPADMTEEEKEIAASVPDTAPPPATLPPVNEKAIEFVKSQIQSENVLIWSLEYCEFCWTLMRLFDAIGVKYKVINIDSFEYAKDNLGNQYRSALQSTTDCVTFPQCFIGGIFFGGAADACIKWKSGELQEILREAGVDDSHFEHYSGDAFEFLPKWMSQNPLRAK